MKFGLFGMNMRPCVGPAEIATVAHAAEEAGFDVLLSTDKNIRYQQNLKDRRIAIVVLGNPRRPAVHRHIDRVIEAVNAATPGSYTEVNVSAE